MTKKRNSNHSQKITLHFNDEQRNAYEAIYTHINERKPGAIFLDAPGGTGKTFLLNTVLSKIRSNGDVIIAVSSSGISAMLLAGGRTAHSRFAVPILCLSDSSSSINLRSNVGKMLFKAVAIVWDEAPMQSKHIFNFVDKLFRNIMRQEIKEGKSCEDLPFGGKPLIFGGDFRQGLPVIPRASRATIVQSTLRESNVWKQGYTKELHLKVNERIRRLGVSAATEQFSKFLMNIGNGVLEGHTTLPADLVRIPDEYLHTPISAATAVSDLIDWTYPELNNPNVDFTALSSRAILTPLNCDVEELNSIAVSKMIANGSQTTTYLSADSIIDDTDFLLSQMYPIEFLQSLTPSGFPPHNLNLLNGMPLILLRNLDQDEGLCNGTKLILRSHTPYRLKVEICNGPKKGSFATIPRIDLIDQNDVLPFHLKRRQFPVRIAFAITISKSQGQSLSRVAVYLPRPTFTHGQLYVALSRAGSPTETKILINDIQNIQGAFPPLAGTYTKNIVFKEVLSR